MVKFPRSLWILVLVYVVLCGIFFLVLKDVSAFFVRCDSP